MSIFTTIKSRSEENSHKIEAAAAAAAVRFKTEEERNQVNMMRLLENSQHQKANAIRLMMCTQ